MRVRAADDNASYWSIATTLRSDNRSLHAIDDALGLSQSLLGTYAEATNSVIDALSEVKAKLVLATEPGVDFNKVQASIVALQDNVRSILSSASFSGTNWVETDVPAIGQRRPYEVELPTHLLRGPDNTFSVGTTTADLSRISMFNLSGGGAIQAATGGPSVLPGIENATRTHGLAPRMEFQFTGPATFGPTDTISFDIEIEPDLQAFPTVIPISVDKATVDAALGTSDGVVSSSRDWAKVLQYAKRPISDDTLKFDGKSYAGLDGYLGITTNRTATGRSIWSLEIDHVVGTLPMSLGLSHEEPRPYIVYSVQASFPFGAPFEVEEDSPLTFTVSMTEREPQVISLRRQDVSNVLGSTDGMVNSSVDLANILNAIFSSKNIPASFTEWMGSLYLNPSSAVNRWGPNSYVILSDGPPGVYRPSFDFYDVDVTQSTNTLDEYVKGVEYMIARATDAAAYIGALQGHLETSASIVHKMSSSIEKGVGRLVDANMEQSATRLAALKVQQDLALQGLNIANTNAANIQRLFG